MEEDLRLAEQAWVDAKQVWEDETELYNEYMNEYNMWVELMQAEQDLDLWREYQKGANEAWDRVSEQEYWYQLATDEWEYQDGEKAARTAIANAERAAEAREQAQMYRDGIMSYYESELEGLEE
jgi:hypothetical protein